MDRFLRLPRGDRVQAFTQAAARRGLPFASIEKDFWVCLLLREVFDLPEHGEHLTFKGGTSLSKAWGLIDRFSEDVDLTLDRAALGFAGERQPEAATSGKEQRRRLDRLKQACREAIRDQIQPALATRLASLLAKDTWHLEPDRDAPDGQTLLFQYPRQEVATASRYITPLVRLEFGARSDPWPVAPRTISAIVAEEFPALFRHAGCPVRALRPERTFLEKVMLLHEETFRPQEKTRRPRMARHYYDVWRLIEAGVGEQAIADRHLFDQVAAHRKVYFRHTWVDYDTLARRTLRITPPAEHVEAWRKDYEAMRREMFAGTPPTFDEILARLTAFEAALNSR